MFEHQAELLVANAILGASGTYQAPTFGALNTPTQIGSYYSYRGFTSAGYYNSNQVWSGSANIILRGDPQIGTSYGRNDFGGGSGNDVLYGSTGNYTSADGNGGNDLIIATQALHGIGDTGNDVIVAGMDINVATSGNYLPVWQSKLANANNMTADELHKLFKYGAGESTLIGDEGNDVLIAMSADDHKLYGDSLDNTGNGNDTLIAGDGNNLLYAANGDNIIMAGNGNNDIRSGSGADVIMVGAGENNIESGAGNDHIEMLSHYNSEVDAGAGDDIIILANKISYVNGGSGYDVLSYELSTTGLNISMQGVYNIEALAGTQLSDTISGSKSDDRLEGLAGNDIIYADAGNDLIYGGTGNDQLYGEAGNDFYFESGQFGQDIIVEEANSGTDDRILFTDLKLSDVVYGRQGNDLVWGDSTLTNAAIVSDWFVNFGIDSFWFTTGVSGQYNYVTAQTVAEAFGVNYPGSSQAIEEVLAQDTPCSIQDVAMSTEESCAGSIDIVGHEVTILDPCFMI